MWKKLKYETWQNSSDKTSHSNKNNITCISIDTDNDKKSDQICYPAKMGPPPGSPDIKELDQDYQWQKYHISNLTYYPRYKPWWRYIRNVKTRPEYERIFPPFWNTYHHPNYTSDEYYEKVVEDNIMPEAKHNPQIKVAHDQNFMLRQAFQFNNRPSLRNAENYY